MKFRRKSRPDDAEPADGEGTAPGADGAGSTGSNGRTGTAAHGPWDAEERPDDSVPRIDLGSLQVAQVKGLELRLQVDQKSQVVQAVVLTGEDGALELRAFAAPRGGTLWDEVRPQIAAQIAQRGGTAGERVGRWGPELVVQSPVSQGDGAPGVQQSRILGIDGPRWMLRATLLGKPAVDGQAAAAWEGVLSQTVVRRGSEPKPVGEALPITMPPTAAQAD